METNEINETHDITSEKPAVTVTTTMLFTFKNIKASPITSILGLIIILASVGSIFIKTTTTWADAVIGITIGALFLFSPDTVVENIKKFIPR